MAKNKSNRERQHSEPLTKAAVSARIIKFWRDAEHRNLADGLEHAALHARAYARTLESTLEPVELEKLT